MTNQAKTSKKKLIIASIASGAALLIVIIAILLAAFSNNGIIGKYKLATVLVGDTTVDEGQLSEYNLDVWLELKEDGTGVLTAGDITKDIYYDEDGKTIISDGDKLNYTINNGRLSVTKNSAIFIFAK